MSREQDPDIFPPMDADTFAAKLAAWNARAPKPKKPPKNAYFRPAKKRIPKKTFNKHIAAVAEGRRKHAAEKLLGDRVDGVIT